MIRICYIIPSLGLGGSEKFLLELIKHLSTSDYNFQIICLYKGGFLVPLFEEKGISVCVVGMKNIYDIRGLIKVFKVLQSFNPDIIHTKLTHSDIISGIINFVKSGPVLVSTVESYHEWERAQTLKMFIKKQVLSLIYRKFYHVIIPVCNYIKQQICSMIDIPDNKIKVIYNGVDTSFFSPNISHPHKKIRNHFGLNEQDYVIGTIGRLNEVKNQTLLLEAIAHLQHNELPLKCLIVGDGYKRKDLEKRAAELGCERIVRFIDAQRDVRNILDILDIFVLPSRAEGLSITLLEAMAMEKPVIATAVGGNQELIRNGQNGFLVPPGDSNTLASIILHLFQHPHKAVSVGKAARQYILEHFDINIIAHKYNTLYKTLLNN